MKHIPNILTSLRIVLTGVFAWQFFVALEVAANPANSVGDYAFWLPIGIYAVAFLTDVLDGFLARTFHWITPVGKMLDPIADKLMGVTALACILLGKIFRQENAAAYIVLIALVVLKELLMLIGGAWMLTRHRVAYADWFGKSATGVFTAGVILTLLSFALPWIEPWNLVAIAVSTAMSYIALVHYARTQMFAKQEDREYTEDEQKLFAKVDRFLGRAKNEQDSPAAEK
ncbi:MAG: CDP-alcohol phosphatidyltransferase family protein [Clostridia bacterium]|nr:CDP-alcohol phosphatidyltransferase family protein [Clostridia bacterium]